MGTYSNKRIFRARARQGCWGLGTSSTGKDQVAVLFDITTEGADVQSITWYGYFTDATFDRTVESLRYCGWEGDDLSNLDGLDANEVDLVIEDEDYNGNISPKVQWVNRVGGLALTAPMDDQKAKSFAAQMRDRIRALDASQGRRKPAAAPAGQRPAATQQQARPAQQNRATAPARQTAQRRPAAPPPEPPHPADAGWDEKDIPF